VGVDQPHFWRMALQYLRISNIDTSTPQGLATAFRGGATECFYNTAELNEGRTANLTGHYIVTLHAIELGLKAFLAKHGLKEAELSRSPYGHDLDSLYSKAVALGLSLTVPDVQKIIGDVNAYHMDASNGADLLQSTPLSTE
jgi:hypothetical protein